MAIYFDPRTGQYVQVTPGGQKTNLKMQTTVNTSQAPGTTGGATAPGATPPPAQPPAGGAGGAAGTGGGGTVNTQGGNISQGAVYGGTVTNTASGGTGSLDASGGSNNVYRETAAPAPAPAAAPPPGGAIPGTPPGAECGTDKPCPEGKFCKMGVCEPIPDQPPGDMQSFQQFMSSRTMPNAGTGVGYVDGAARPILAAGPAPSPVSTPMGSMTFGVNPATNEWDWMTKP